MKSQPTNPMTIDELNKLTDDEVKSRVAEQMGYRWSMPDEAWFLNGSYAGRDKVLPNYPADLNAMHEAEKTLTDSSQRIRYQNALYDLGPKDPAVSGWHWTTADARARAIAFLAVTEQPMKGR